MLPLQKTLEIAKRFKNPLFTVRSLYYLILTSTEMKRNEEAEKLLKELEKATLQSGNKIIYPTNTSSKGFSP